MEIFLFETRRSEVFYFHSKSILFASKRLFYLQKKFMVAAVFIFFLFLARNGHDKSLFIRYILNKNVHLTTHCSVAVPLKTFFGKRGRRRRRRNLSSLFYFQTRMAGQSRMLTLSKENRSRGAARSFI